MYTSNPQPGQPQHCAGLRGSRLASGPNLGGPVAGSPKSRGATSRTREPGRALTAARQRLNREEEAAQGGGADRGGGGGPRQREAWGSGARPRRPLCGRGAGLRWSPLRAPRAPILPARWQPRRRSTLRVSSGRGPRLRSPQGLPGPEWAGAHWASRGRKAIYSGLGEERVKYYSLF